MISIESVYVDPQKVEVVLNWEQPTSVTEVQNFLGLAGYYRCLVENFSRIAAPLLSGMKSVKKVFKNLSKG